MGREAICLFCKKRFWQKQAEYYCSDECERKANEAFKRGAKAQSYRESPAVCPVCGKPFMKGLKKKYCSDICRDYANTGKAREQRKMKTLISESKGKVKRSGRRKAPTVAAINEAAREEHLSYGEYVEKYKLW